MSADAARFPRGWRQRAVLVPLTRALRAWYRPRVHGLEGVPLDRPVVFVAKHPRAYLYLETMLLGLLTFWDSARPPFRPMEQRGTSLHRLPVLSWIRRHVGTIAATEEAGLAALRGGESVLVFPGGARELYGAPDRLDWHGRRGFARLAALAQAPVVPVAIGGADQQHPLRLPLGRRGSLWLPPLPLPVGLDYWFGQPLPPPAAAPAAVAAFADEVAAATQALIDRSRLARARRSEPTRQGSAIAEGGAVSLATPPPAGPPPLDEASPLLRRVILPWARLLSRYHRVTLAGAPPAGPCIYVALHGAGYLVADLVLAGYVLQWQGWFERGEPHTPLRIVAAESRIERFLPGLPRAKVAAGLIGTAEADCRAVLERGEQLLVTPGGQREAQPRRDFYRLRWDGRYGFVRLALATGAPIVPLAVVGGAEAYPGFRWRKLSFWSPLPLPARVRVALGEPIAVARRPEAVRDLAVVKPLHALAWERTQALYDGLRSGPGVADRRSTASGERRAGEIR